MRSLIILCFTKYFMAKKHRRMSWVERVALRVDVRYWFSILGGRPENKWSHERSRHRSKWKGYTKWIIRT
jgi:hypothetical protein